MKSLLTLLLLSSAWMACAQDYASPEPVEIGKELSRTTFVVYPTAEEAAAGSREASKYFTPLTEWEKTTTEAGTEFSTKFTVPFAWVNRQVLLHVEWASSAYEIRLNGKVAGYCQNGSNPADYNFTKQVREGANNLTIKVLSNPASTVLESWAHPSEPALGSCYVFSQPTIRIRDLFTKTYRNGSVFNGEVGIVVKTDALNPKKAKIHYELLTPQDEVVTYGSQEIELDMRREDTLRLVAQIPDTMVWSARNPILYTLRLKTQTEGRYTEYVSLKVGFRTVGNTGAVGDQRVSGSTQGRTRLGYDRIAEPTARMEGTGVQPDSASGRRRIRCAVRPLRPIWLLCRRTGSDQHQPQRYVPPQGRESQQRSRMAGGLYRPYRGELPHHETASVRRSILARRRFRQRNQPLRRLSPPQGPRKGAPGSLPRCRRRVEQRQTPAVGRTIIRSPLKNKKGCLLHIDSLFSFVLHSKNILKHLASDKFCRIVSFYDRTRTTETSLGRRVLTAGNRSKDRQRQASDRRKWRVTKDRQRTTSDGSREQATKSW